MKIFITGVDGYIGWPLFNYLQAHGYELSGIDNGARRIHVNEVGGMSVIPIDDMRQRFGDGRYRGDLLSYYLLLERLKDFKPDVIVHLGEQPSAPFSMMNDVYARETQVNNVIGTLNLLWAAKEACPEAHIITTATMGEYGTPGIPIPEGKFPEGSLWDTTLTHISGGSNGDLSGLQFPRSPGSFYHASKVHDSVNCELACRIWNMRITDVMQGVVYGTRTEIDVPSPTRFDIDECFGTVINRFCAQAVAGIPLTIYGLGRQTRGYLPLQDVMQSLRLLIENPADIGEYRVVNQLAETLKVIDIANGVQMAAKGHGFEVEVQHVDNPRIEKEDHAYEVACDTLGDLGYIATTSHDVEIYQILGELIMHRDRIESVRNVIAPKTQWEKS